MALREKSRRSRVSPIGRSFSRRICLCPRGELPFFGSSSIGIKGCDIHVGEISHLGKILELDPVGPCECCYSYRDLYRDLDIYVFIVLFPYLVVFFICASIPPQHVVGAVSSCDIVVIPVPLRFLFFLVIPKVFAFSSSKVFQNHAVFIFSCLIQSRQCSVYCSFYCDQVRICVFYYYPFSCLKNCKID